ncbi:MAG: class I SAM-dependent methyltransferase [Prolixibacteraceae bacterium]|nr:class I SAM-dependent methyltransferase [Prolixibacteraceae bacterium]
MSDNNVVDAKLTNPNLDKIHELFYKRVSKFFNDNGSPKPELFEDVPCYNCNSTSVKTQFTISRFRHVRCAQCGMVYVTPRIKESILHDSYDEDDYSEHYRLKIVPSLKYRREVLGERKYKQIMSYFEKPGSILDIGCGLGDLLSVFKDHGWDCMGIEFNKFAANYGRDNFGLNIIDKSIFDFEPKEYQFDCIMLWGVLEHFTSPMDVLLKAYQLLKKGGLLVLEVPSGDSILVRYYETYGGYVDRIIEGDRHIMLFSARSLQEMAKKAGFDLIELKSNGLDIDTLARLNKENISAEFTTRLQSIVDSIMCGDLLRGFWKK